MAGVESKVSRVKGPTLEPGRIVAGKFRLTREIGQGGMGAVWAAVHQALGREVAVKFLHPQVDQSPSVAERFVSEARMVASIKHRFVVDVFDFGVTEDGLYYMVLELLQGSSLADRMDAGPALPLPVAVQLMADCMRGLQVVHDAGIVHRDLKPDNIFVIEDADGVFPKLIDFGISKRTEVNGALPPLGKLGAKKSRLTQPGMVVGTPYYMSPEQLRGRNDLDRRSDVYSVGVILYELLVGQLPFEQDNIGDLMVAITVQGAPSLMHSRPELGSALANVIARTLAPDPNDRYQTAMDLRDALLACLPSLPLDAESVVQSAVAGRRIAKPSPVSPAARVSPLPPRVQSPAKTRTTRAASLIVASLMLIAMLVWLLHKPESEPSVIQLRVTPDLPPASTVTAPTPQLPAASANPPAAIRPEPSSVEPVVKHPAPAAPVRRAAPAAVRRPAATAPGPNRGDKPQKLYRKLDF